MEGPGKLLDTLTGQLSAWKERSGYDLTSQIDSRAISAWLAENLKNAGGRYLHDVHFLGHHVFPAFYMFTAKENVRIAIYGYVPLKKENLRAIGDEIGSMVRSNALGIPLVAVAQGIVAVDSLLYLRRGTALLLVGDRRRGIDDTLHRHLYRYTSGLYTFHRGGQGFPGIGNLDIWHGRGGKDGQPNSSLRAQKTGRCASAGNLDRGRHRRGPVRVHRADLRALAHKPFFDRRAEQ